MKLPFVKEKFCYITRIIKKRYKVEGTGFKVLGKTADLVPCAGLEIHSELPSAHRLQKSRKWVLLDSEVRNPKSEGLGKIKILGFQNLD